MSQELQLISKDADRFKEMNDVMERYVKNENPTAIARELGIRRVDVLKHIEDWRAVAVGSDVMRDRVEELLATMDEHFSTLIREAWKTLDTVNAEFTPGHQMLAQRTAAIKVISDLESSRVDILQKAGMLEAADLGDEFAEQEERQQVLIGILREVTSTCPRCKTEVASRLGSITNKAETVAP